MKSVIVNYTEKLKLELEKYDIPFAFDEKTITVFLDQNSVIPSSFIAEQILPAIVPVLKRPVYIKDHFLIKNWLNSPFSNLYIVCFPQDTSFKNIKNIKYKTLIYKGKKVNNDNGQEYMQVLDIPDFALPIKDDNGITIGFIAYNIINIFFDIMHVELQALHLELIRDTVDSYLKIENSLKELFNEYLSVKGRTELIKYIKNISEREKEKLKREISDYEYNINKYTSAIIDWHKSLRNTVLKLKGIESEKINIEEEVEKLITEHDIKFNTEGLIWFETEDIYIKSILIGRFRITLNLEQGSIKIKNLTRKIQEYDHPHIRNEILCLGELNVAITKLTSEYKFIEVAKLCKEMLYFYNPSSAHMQIERWITTKKVVTCT